MRFCPVCSYYLYLQDSDKTPTTIKEKQPWMALKLQCRHCGYSEKMAPKTSEEALILETTFGGESSTKQKVSALNAYTRLDPTLPHLNTIPCPNQSCTSQADPESRDILYIKTDAKNMKYQYACTVCNTQWGS
jgi:DNA-directed RNA polymerase subunit M/transcription elongation factor TFIIS